MAIIFVPLDNLLEEINVVIFFRLKKSLKIPKG
jgi:hypothetical protein